MTLSILYAVKTKLEMFKTKTLNMLDGPSQKQNLSLIKNPGQDLKIAGLQLM